MTRRNLATALQQVSIALVESEIVLLFDTIFTREGIDTAAALEAFQKYSRLSSLYGESERKIVDIFHLSDLEKTSFWNSIITGDGETYARVSPVKDRIELLIKYVPELLKLVEQDGITPEGKLQKTEVTHGKELLTIILPEDNNKFSSPQRLINAIESIEFIYSVCARLEGFAENDLAVVAVDSGSDKSFDFIGAAKIIECVKDTIIALWDRIVFFRERKQSERLDLIEKSLPLVERINRLELEQELSSEQAEIFRRNIFSGIHKFSSAGAVIPELHSVSSYNPRKLMAPEAKLLVEKNPISSATPQQQIDSKSNALSAEEMKQLKDFMDRMGGVKNDE